MIKLDDIGFYTLSDERARRCSTTSPMSRACFVLTSRCNFRCPYCKGVVSAKKDFDTQVVIDLLADLKLNHRLESVRFTGGEPTLHTGLLAMVGMAHYHRIPKIAVSTNGSAASNLYLRLVYDGVNDFSISADCCDVEMAARLSGRDGMWERVKENIRLLSETPGVNVIIGTTITAENVESIPKTLQFLADLGVDDIKLATATGFEGEIPRHVLEAIPKALIDRMPVLRYRVANYLCGRQVRGLVEGRDSRRCLWVQDDIVLTPAGHFPCIVYPREGGQPIGPLRSTVAEMREERKTWALGRDSFEDPICRKFCMDIFADCNKRIEELGPRQERLHDQRGPHRAAHGLGQALPQRSRAGRRRDLRRVP